MTSSYPPLEPPETPILLYIGAGYDFSPLLTFAPKGEPYPILPISASNNCSPPWPADRYTYTSFIFVDAKPRHTSAFMVPDFKEWETKDVRVKNVLHYSQGILDRWRPVHGAPDLIIFEGGGSPSQINARRADSAWTFAAANGRSAKKGAPRPLTTVFYLFNTLDIEMVRTPRMEQLWHHVEALYVHGLRIHPQTGAGIGPSMGGGYGLSVGTPNVKGKETASASIEELESGLGEGLKRCFVLVGSWDGKNGVRHVDFVKRAMQKRRNRLTIQAPLIGPRLSTSSDDDSDTVRPDLRPCPKTLVDFWIPSTPSMSSSRTSMSITNSPSTPTSEPSDSSSSIPTVAFPSATAPTTSPTRSLHRRLALSIFSFFSFHSPHITSKDKEPPRTRPFLDNPSFDPFHIPIPQIGYSASLPRPSTITNKRSRKSKKGAYYISRTIDECMELSRGEKTNWEDEVMVVGG